MPRISLREIYSRRIRRKLRLRGKEIKLQTTAYSCGPTALHNAMLMLGKEIDIDKLIGACGTTREGGTNERQLARGARKFGCNFRIIESESEEEIKEKLNKCLKKPYPILAAVDDWSHWVVILHTRNNKYIVLDSSRPGPALKVYTWKKLKRRLKNWTTYYDFCVLVPRFKCEKFVRFSYSNVNYNKK